MRHPNLRQGAAQLIPQVQRVECAGSAQRRRRFSENYPLKS